MEIKYTNSNYFCLSSKGAFSVYMEQSLEKFQQNQELAMFCAKSIAFSLQLDEDSPVSPQIVIVAEITSAISILKFRYFNIWKTTHLIKYLTFKIYLHSRFTV